MLLKDCHCGILNGAEKTIFYAETKREKSFVEKICEKTQIVQKQRKNMEMHCKNN